MAKLPSAYQEVEYIQSSGTQRIDTGVRPNDTTYGFECKFNLTSTSGDWNIMNLGANGISPEDGRYRYGFGGYTTQSWQIGYLMYSGSNSEACYATITNPTPASGIDYISIYNYNGNKSWSLNGSTYVDGTLKTGSYTYGINWNIFCQATGTSNYERFASMKLYYMKIYHGTTLVRNFVPCYRKSDDVIGLYDTVNNTFYTNSGTGTFTKGPNVEYPPEYKLHGHIGTWHMESVKDYSAMQGPCPDGFHVPTMAEWQDVKTIWTALGGGSNDATNFSANLKLPMAGRRQMSADIYISDNGHYWSSTPYNSNARSFNLYSGLINGNTHNRSYGFSVRGFKNSPVVPTSSWTKLYGTSIAAGGIFWNSTSGLISLSSNGTTWITIQDKNLGATTVWNSGDTLTDANCGCFYQWGNNYGFPHSGSVTTSSTQVNASNYGPGNYYSSSTFITGNSWDSSNNGNLWGGETGVVIHYIPRS